MQVVKQLTQGVLIAVFLAAHQDLVHALPETHSTHLERSRLSFYGQPEGNIFHRTASVIETDKVTVHNYETLYSKYFELMQNRLHVRRIFEIGLGCNMGYGPGHSIKLWRLFFPNAEIWMAEYDQACADKYRGELLNAGVKIVTGDQADLRTLRSWVNITGGNFDVIIDDGGHSSMQQYNSLVVLFLHALRPGGVYILEDMQVARTPQFIDGDRSLFMIDVVKDMIEALVLDPNDGLVEVSAYKPRYGLLPFLKMIDCQRAACVFTKCQANDRRCDNPRYDMSLLTHG